MLTTVQTLNQLQLDVAKRAYEASESRYTTIRAVAIAAILVGVLLAVIFGAALEQTAA